ncbi:Ankyrin repeat-containing protein BDA1 [Camellia lanceoleosa]|uniref:Ankyrin repeat-containing protein BDA1 n=1 Tax=Camellia lanceoleosa TaxID=1840588 RepID=A0ACC0J105_9ERIC|nr:Ankyrin repeat-containing protein BDA1 [Camellia lanceoleosa]
MEVVLPRVSQPYEWKMEMKNVDIIASVRHDMWCLCEACKNGDWKLAERLIQDDKKWCFKKNRFGMTPLHIAPADGRIDVVNWILKYCPQSVKEVTAMTIETSLHVATNHNETEVVMHLLKWIIGERPDFLYLLDFKTYKGKTSTAVQFPTLSKQFQTLGVLPPLNSSDSVALDISYDLPDSKNIGIDWIRQEPRDLTTQKFKHSDVYSSNGSYDLPQSENMGNMDIRHEPWVIIDSDLTKQKIKQSDLYSDNGSCDLPQSKIVDIAIFCLAKSESMIAWDFPKQKIKHNEKCFAIDSHIDRNDNLPSTFSPPW